MKARLCLATTWLLVAACQHGGSAAEREFAVVQPAEAAIDKSPEVETSSFDPKTVVRDRQLATPDASKFAATIAEYQLEVDGKPLRMGSHRPNAISSYAIFDHGNGPKWLDLNEFDGEPQSGWAWVALEPLPDGAVLAVLDWTIESSGPDLHVVRYDGSVWREIAVLQKPHYYALLEQLTVKSDEHWELRVDLTDCGGCTMPTGSYIYTTTDGGSSWSATGP